MTSEYQLYKQLGRKASVQTKKTPPSKSSDRRFFVCTVFNRSKPGNVSYKLAAVGASSIEYKTIHR